MSDNEEESSVYLSSESESDSESVPSTVITKKTPTKTRSSKASSSKKKCKNKKKTSSSSSSKRDPLFSSGTRPFVAMSSPQKKQPNKIESLGQTFSGLTLNSTEYEYDENETCYSACVVQGQGKMEGTKMNPVVVFVNTMYPERQREGFLVKQIEKEMIEDKNQFRNVWHVELVVKSIYDVEHYTATIPHVPYKVCGRHSHPNQILQRDGLITDVIDENNTDRFYMYYLLVLPDNVRLDNNALGDNDDALWWHPISQSESFEEEVEEEQADGSTKLVNKKFDTDGQTLLWKIAEKDYTKTSAKKKSYSKGALLMG